MNHLIALPLSVALAGSDWLLIEGSMLRRCRSRWGKGISMPASARARAMATVTSLLSWNQLSWRSDQKRSSKFSALSPKPMKKASGAGIGHDALVRRGFGHEQPEHAFGIGAIGHADHDLDAALLRGEGPVDDLGGDEVAVGHDDLGALEGDDGAGAGANPPDSADHAGEFDDVVDPYRPFKEQDESGGEVLHDVLQAKADAHTKRSGDDGELIQIDAGGGDSGQQDKHAEDVVGDLGGGVGHSALEREPGDQDVPDDGTEGFGEERTRLSISAKRRGHHRR